jgi:hypothetical protein
MEVYGKQRNQFFRGRDTIGRFCRLAQHGNLRPLSDERISDVEVQVGEQNQNFAGSMEQFSVRCGGGSVDLLLSTG